LTAVRFAGSTTEYRAVKDLSPEVLEALTFRAAYREAASQKA
jgi:hypothetical protein